MYLIVAFAITVLVIAFAWRGVGHARQNNERPAAREPRRPTRFVAPDDDPEFLSEIDRKLRDEGMNNN